MSNTDDEELTAPITYQAQHIPLQGLPDTSATPYSDPESFYDYLASPSVEAQDSGLSLAEMHISEQDLDRDLDFLLSSHSEADEDMLLIASPEPILSVDMPGSDEELLTMSLDSPLELDSPLPVVPARTPRKTKKQNKIRLPSPPSPPMIQRVVESFSPPPLVRRRKTRQPMQSLARMPSPPPKRFLQPDRIAPEEAVQETVQESAPPKKKKKIVAALKQGKRSAFLVKFTEGQSESERRESVIEALASIILSLVMQLSLSLQPPSPPSSEAEEDTQTQTQSPAQTRTQKRKRRRKTIKPKIIPFARVPPLRLEIINRASKEEDKIKRVSFPNRRGTSHGAKELAILVRLVELISDGLVAGVVATKRDLYYKDVARFGKQVVVDRLVDDLAATIGCRRFDLNIIAASKGLVFGSCVLHLKNGEAADARQTTQLISPNELIESIETGSARFVLVVEKETVFQTLRAAPTMAEGILITGKGYPDTSTRELVKSLCDILPANIPICCLVDGDPHGLDIMSTYRYGSVSMAFDNENLIATRLEWLGIKMAAVADAGISRDRLLALTPLDQKKALSMLQKDLPQDWKRELQIMLHLQRKAEIEIFSENQDNALILYVTNSLQARIEALRRVDTQN